MKNTLLEEVHVDLLVKVFRNEISDTPFVVKKFRVGNSDYLEVLDYLETNTYITNQTDVYHLKIEALSLICDMEPTAAHYIEQMKPIFNMLVHTYRAEPDSILYLRDIEQEFHYPRVLINRFAEFLYDLPFFGGRSTDLSLEDAYVMPSESILKYRTMADAIEKVKSRREPLKKQRVEDYYRIQPALGDFSFLLHTRIAQIPLKLYHDGYLREAVLNSMIALFDFIRERSGLQEDGSTLINEAFSIDKPCLVFSDIHTESGKNDQKGFMQILRGAYQGIRNPQAHTLDHDLTEVTAAQYLVFASMLMRKIEEAQLVSQE
ncbi:MULTISPECIES: TIGR02391 family protein [Bacteria]|nr:TIGR02391 family protein [Merismopedia glauca]